MGCKKNQKSDSQCFNVKIISSICSTTVLQIQDPAFEYLGEDGWLNPLDNKIYDNVFTLKNYCDNINRDGKVIFKVKMKEGTDINYNCVVCLALFPGPVPKTQLALMPCD
jgi:hypothetical protein